MVRPGIYRHYKGNLYEVIGIAHHSETLEEVVTYRALYHSPEFGNNALWVRPAAMFLETIEVNSMRKPRFEYVGPHLPDQAPFNDTVLALRKTKYRVLPQILKRWSPRAMTGQPISHEELMTLFEAAHWAPSAYNSQPWRFIYAVRDTPAWEKFYHLMVPFNQEWTKNTAVLVVIVSKNNLEQGKPSPTHSFDAGAAWAMLALQGSTMGLVVHGMSGFDFEKARKDLNVPDEYTVEAMCAIGKPADKSVLPEKMQLQEAPSTRKDVEEICFEGSFNH